ncbi:hypothetical protein COY28_02010 [Candidatus Woesearchaeota archaeon CG_4_10_14_0_2_um_filter_57_5]|nr:MAG: hypothetical protein AUJ68_03160 [Candidatus Woesearchaeota archaeon CG1_02_57_44]PIZ55274.1 MAG: hypothetical protein COY28_02010 [Candidatus Woesearchaeota archaeon CG_4_10_14_0_2_um_filter_57_5]
MHKTAQTWTLDFIVSVALFMLTLLLVARLLTNTLEEPTFPRMSRDAMVISSHLMSEGIPSNWTNDTVIIPGLLSNGQLNTTKWAQLHDLPYDTLKDLFHTPYDIALYLQNASGIINLSVCALGHETGYGYQTGYGDACAIYPPEARNLASVTRLMVYHNALVELHLYVWQ